MKPSLPPSLSPSTRPKRNQQRNKRQIPCKPRRTTHSLPQKECPPSLAYEPSAQVENNLGLVLYTKHGVQSIMLAYAVIN
ncbi:hypothetical protein BDL97_06G119700 [Sphagnum fallax]|nr:hypothetical protein BDL97_06G119700 [Sphagnum fallax]